MRKKFDKGGYMVFYKGLTLRLAKGEGFAKVSTCESRPRLYDNCLELTG